MTNTSTYVDTDVKTNTVYYYKATQYKSNAYQSEGEYGTLVSEASSIASAMVEAYSKVTSGEVYNNLSKRANGSKITCYASNGENGNTVTISELVSGEYVYCVYGDFIVDGATATQSNGKTTVKLPYENADAIVFAEKELVNYGDVNGDGDFSLVDVVKTLKYTVGNATTDFDIAAANVSKDISISVADILGILKLVLK